jgi:hypothetical protein
VLKVYWDDEKEPSIQVPLADFFGAIGGETIDYQSSPMQINRLCYMCYLPMPFSRQARFILANDGDKDYDENMAYTIDYEKDQQYAREKSRLHCMWRRSNPVKGGAPPLDHLITPSQSGGKNNFNTRHTILDVRGRGQYVGNFLQVYTKNRRWWGEGITIFHLDGKTMVHRAGTENEYGSSWCFGGTCSYPYYGYLQNQQGNNRMYRWYLPNPMRFQESLKVEIQDIAGFGTASDICATTLCRTHGRKQGRRTRKVTLVCREFVYDSSARQDRPPEAFQGGGDGILIEGNWAHDMHPTPSRFACGGHPHLRAQTPSEGVQPETLRFPAPIWQFAVLPDFPVERLRDCHLGIQSIGKPSEIGVFSAVEPHSRGSPAIAWSSKCLVKLTHAFSLPRRARLAIH